MSVSLRRLIGMKELDLTVIVGDESGEETTRRLDAPIDWVYASSLVDPMRFLPPSQLLLTDGAQFQARDFDFDAYVSRLCDGELIGLGLGTGLTWRECPPELAHACADHRLPLVEIPYHVPFIKVIRSVDDLQEQERQQHVRWGLDAQRAISRAAMRSSDLGAVLDELSSQLGCGVAVFDGAGELRDVSRQTRLGETQLHELSGAIDRLIRTGTRSAARVDVDGSEFIVQTIGAPPSVSGLLVLSGVGRLDGVQLDVVQSVLAFAGISLEFNRILALQRHAVRGGVISVAAAGELPAANRIARRLWNERIPSEERAVIHVITPPEPLVGQLDRLQRTPGVFWGMLDDRAVIVAARPRLTEAVSLCRSHAVRAGVSRTSAALPLGRLVDEARQVAETTVAPEVVRYEAVADSGWHNLLRGSMLSVIAAQLLAPLDERSRAEGAQLRETLRVWLQTNGQAEATAQRLGVHRHTVRNRIARAATLLDMDLDSFENRTKIWLALNAIDDQR